MSPYLMVYVLEFMADVIIILCAFAVWVAFVIAFVR